MALGRETFIGVQTLGGATVTVHAEPDAAAVQGDRVRFGLEPGRLHIFDVETQRALARV